MLKYTRVIIFIFYILPGISFGEIVIDNRLQDILNNIENISGNFSQKIYSDNNKLLQESTGTLIIKRPNLIRWQILKPEKSLIVTNGKKIWNFEEELDQVTIQPFAKDHTHSPVEILSGETKDLTINYTIESIENDRKGKCLGDSLECYRLIPIKENNNGFKTIDLGFVDKKIANLQFTDNLGQLSILIFDSIVVNSKLDENLFEFYPPDGIDIMNEE